jgi:hypothetical protein
MKKLILSPQDSIEYIYGGDRGDDTYARMESCPEFPIKEFAIIDVENTVDLKTGDPSARRAENKVLRVGVLTDTWATASPTNPVMFTLQPRLDRGNT